MMPGPPSPPLTLDGSVGGSRLHWALVFAELLILTLIVVDIRRCLPRHHEAALPVAKSIKPR